MNTARRVLIVIALAGWSWYAGQWLGGALMAALVCASLHNGLRVDMTPRDYFRVADLTSVLFAGLAVLCFVRYGFRGIYQIMIWLPYVVFPLVIAQCFNGVPGIPRAALFASLRRRYGDSTDGPQSDTVLPYFMACLVAASVAAPDAGSFVAFAGGALGALLLAAPARRHALPVRGVFVVAVALAGLSVAVAAFKVQQQLEDLMVYLAAQFIHGERDPNQVITAIGSVSRLKTVDKIVLRIDAAPIPRLPLLLTEAMYTRFDHGVWSLPDNQFVAVDALPGQALWPLTEPARSGTGRLDIHRLQRREVSTVPLPVDAATVGGGDIFETQRNGVDTVMLEMPVGESSYQVTYGPPAPAPYRPAEFDLRVPDSYAALIDRYARDLELAALPPAAAAARIIEFFETHYAYTLEPRRRFPSRYPLRTFLETTRSGHCEYFATATVLMLRSAGVPARYAVGYLVQEYSEFEQRWIARLRHRHAWALAYIDGRWQSVDATPPGWFDIEDQAAPPWQGVMDLANWLLYKTRRFGRGPADDNGLLAPLTVTALTVVLAVLIYRRRRGRPDHRAADTGGHVRQGLDSALIPLLEQLEQRHPPAPAEPLRAWLTRCVGGRDETMDRAVTLHYRYRFDPSGISPTERNELTELAALLGRRLVGADLQ
ncbi:MAG: transglutaminase domain-containing protein [Gammaproteobacteria bacterium]|nr:transglutaminase domain-containing protein [Gammaproteobacteria bacterium]